MVADYEFGLHCNCTYVLNICFALIWCFAEPRDNVIRGRNIYIRIACSFIVGYSSSSLIRYLNSCKIITAIVIINKKKQILYRVKISIITVE